MPDPMHFDRHAALYDRARPPYPDSLRDRLRQLGLLTPGRRALDLGAGSGQATRLLVDAGMDVTAVEPGPALADILQQRFPRVHVVRSTAEEYVPEPGSLDLVTIATAVHWFDLGRVLPSLRRALAPGGRVAVWRTVYGDTSVPPSPFRGRVQAIADRRDASARPGPDETETEAWARLLTAGGLFVVDHREELRWSIVLDADGIQALFTTFSDWSEAEAEQAAEAVRELGGTVVEHYVTPLIVLAPAG
ncbi:class I SAM-dependent methyltransferase [Leifsonia sp. 22587]|uniref:class I SAM-dependent methyltransferase n=1 Tax=Leifsonia sp. 22587 TaxID=3453946 RepID=UPI003F848FCD